MHDIGKGSTAKLEWKPSREPFNFGSFGSLDPLFSCNLKTEEEGRDELRCDLPPPSTLQHIKEKASQIDTKKTRILNIDGGGTTIVISDALVHLEEQIRLQTSVPHALAVSTRTTPSYVAFTDTERLIGDAAKNQTAMYLTSTVFDAMQLIGRRFNDSFSDSSVQSDMKLWLFKVIVGLGDKPMIMVNYKGKEKQFSVEEISSMVLMNMKGIASAANLFDVLPQRNIHKLFDAMSEGGEPKLFAEMPKRDVLNLFAIMSAHLKGMEVANLVLNLLHKVCWPPINGVECFDGLYSFCPKTLAASLFTLLSGTLKTTITVAFCSKV